MADKSKTNKRSLAIKQKLSFFANNLFKPQGHCIGMCFREAKTGQIKLPILGLN